ncbi:MAG: rRNA maturation RNase YbeY [Candidatus Zapsychrus exili]|nr:rRNA maturation RNase YbeY [Candidatus Zapsychrus exili]
MEVIVENLQKKINLKPLQIVKIAKTILRHEGIKKSIVSIVFVTSQKIIALNKKFLGKTYATDVLAFDFKGDAKNGALEGDIIISTDAVIKNSKEFKTNVEEEIALYVIHGILHLLGFDDHKKKDTEVMRLKEKELLKCIKPTIKHLVR